MEKSVAGQSALTTGSGLADIGGPNDDTLLGGDGNDTLFAGDFDDSLNGGAGDDLFLFDPAVTLENDSVTAGAGIDLLDFSRLLQRSADVAGLLGFVEENLHGDAAGEVDVEHAGPVHPAEDHAGQTDHDHQHRDHRRRASPTEEVDLCGTQQSHHRQLGDPAAFFGDVKP